MEADKNPMPEFHLWQPLERLKKIGHFIFDRFYNDQPPLYMSNHYDPDHFRGGAAMLDRELYDQQEFTWTYPGPDGERA